MTPMMRMTTALWRGFLGAPISAKIGIAGLMTYVIAAVFANVPQPLASSP